MPSPDYTELIPRVRAAVEDEITKIAIQSFRGYGLDQLHARLCLDLQHLQEHEAAEAKFAEISDYAASFSETDFNPIPVRARYRYCVADGEVRQLRRHTERLYVLYCKGASDAKN